MSPIRGKHPGAIAIAIAAELLVVREASARSCRRCAWRRGDSRAGSRHPARSLRGITKRYPAVVANDDVDLDVLPGEIHAVLGENGAGKSTLMKIIYGVVKPDAGDDPLGRRSRCTSRNPAQARELGIGMVFQHFSLFDTLTVAENIWLGARQAPTLTRAAAAHPRSVGATTA